MNTVISRTDSFETWRRGTNKISSDLGDANLIGSNFSRRKIVLKNGTITFQNGDVVVGTISKVGSAVTTATVYEVIPNENTIVVEGFTNGNFVDINDDKVLIILDSTSLSGTDWL